MKNLTDYMNTMLFALIGDHELIKQWWITPNRAFEGRCPQDVPEQEVKAYLEGHCYG